MIVSIATLSITTFQLTHSRGVRLGEYAVMWNKRNFNSRTHVECDEICLANRARKAISTHALTWSATFTYSRHPIRKRISTHALTWSATSINHLLPRPKRISTHALTWSATPDQFAESYKWNFNSRTHVECDRIICDTMEKQDRFQLTHSRGVRQRCV